MTRAITLAALLTLALGASAASAEGGNVPRPEAPTGNVPIYQRNDGIIDQIVLAPNKMKGTNDLGVGWPDVEQFVPTGAGAPEITFLAFDASTVESYCFGWKPALNFANTGQLYINIKYCMKTAHAGTVRMRCDFWGITGGESIASFGAANATTSWTIDPSNTALVMERNFYTDVDAYSGAVEGGQMGQVLFSDIGMVAARNEVYCRLYRVANDGTNDTHTGDLDIIRVQFRYKVLPYHRSIGM